MILLNKQRIDRTLKRMTYQITEEAKEMDIVLAGVNRRGFILAERIKEHLAGSESRDIQMFNLKDHDDAPSESIPVPSQNSILVIVDDVIFSGGTIYRCLQKIPELSAYEKILITVLVDRGHRKYPILASIVGLKTSTKLNEHVELRLKNGTPQEVVLINK